MIVAHLVILSGAKMATQAERQPTTTIRRRPGGWSPSRQDEAYLFLLPSFLGFLVFVAGPVIASLGLSFMDWNLINAPKFVGLGNYTALFTRDPVFWQAFGNTAFYSVTIVPLQLLAGLTVALALNQGLRGVKIYRLIYFMPVVSSVVAVALVFQWMFNRDYGVISALFWWLGDTTGLPIAPPDWLNSSVWIKPAVV